MVSEERIEMWFMEFEARLQKERALSMLNEPHRLFDDEIGSSIDGILNGFPASTMAAPSTPAPVTTQSTPSTPSTPSLAAPLTEPLPPDVAQTPLGNESSASYSEYLTALPGMSQNHKKKKGLPPAAITVAEFFRYVCARRAREKQDEKVEQRRKNRELLEKKMVEDEDSMEMDEEVEVADAVMVRKEGERWPGGSMVTCTPEMEQERKEKKKQEAERRRKSMEVSWEVQQKNKDQVIEIMNSAHKPDAEEIRKKLKREHKKKAKKLKRVKREARKEKKSKTEHENDAHEPDAEKLRKQLKENKKKAKKVKQVKQVKKERRKMTKEKKPKAASRKTRKKEEHENEADELRKDTLVESKAKDRANT
ncbi:stress response protein NST1 [Strongylocentrotus purpuratus]|uniref:Uncharacterized protein n=1 Tax=Strongylocentrotus purpuratus TaxID=7668 RepID=A0A7M7NC36_STRPU|nr:stress response protein NST1 [Strongylocentrotus purpuratus]|eukprot:XP_011661739.1 PREDICTED: stress response protein NST1-like [Strongylocentrotus purpuratus]